jgi:anti-sigma regulatory factor (Ser/Thr protein kinase)
MRVEGILRAEPAAVAEARALLNEALGEVDIEPSRRFDALLVMSELVTNAVTHGSRPGDKISLEFDLDARRLRICVRDAARARTFPVALTPDNSRTSGRGVSIVDRLTEWSERIVDGRREVSAELAL